MYPIYTHPLFLQLLSLHLSSPDYAIFGSGPLLLHELRTEIHDLDIVARTAAWERATLVGKIDTSYHGGSVVRLFDGAIEIFNGWGPGQWDTNHLIDTAEVVGDAHLRFVTLENVLKWKKSLDRPKDRSDINLLEKYFKK